MKLFVTSPQIANTNWKTIFDMKMLKQSENKSKNYWNKKSFAKYEIIPISRHQPCLLFNEGEDTGSSSEQQQVTFVWKNKLYFVKTSKYISSKSIIIFCKKSYIFCPNCMFTTNNYTILLKTNIYVLVKTHTCVYIFWFFKIDNSKMPAKCSILEN